jgi:tetratricopeptide (TPR) repeat protein
MSEGIVVRVLTIALLVGFAVTFDGVAALAAEPATQTSIERAIAEGKAEMRKLSRQEFLALIERLIRAGRLDEALKLVAELPDTGQWAFDKRFIVARIAGAKGDFRSAEKIYREMLSADPNLHRVRLELASSLFQRGNFQPAEYHFRLVLAANVPDATKQAIQWHLALSAQQRSDGKICGRDRGDSGRRRPAPDRREHTVRGGRTVVGAGISRRRV